MSFCVSYDIPDCGWTGSEPLLQQEKEKAALVFLVFPVFLLTKEE